jgi:hypothetical protein
VTYKLQLKLFRYMFVKVWERVKDKKCKRFDGLGFVGFCLNNFESVILKLEVKGCPLKWKLETHALAWTEQPTIKEGSLYKVKFFGLLCINCTLSNFGVSIQNSLQRKITKLVPSAYVSFHKDLVWAFCGGTSSVLFQLRFMYCVPTLLCHEKSCFVYFENIFLSSTSSLVVRFTHFKCGEVSYLRFELRSLEIMSLIVVRFTHFKCGEVRYPGFELRSLQMMSLAVICIYQLSYLCGTFFENYFVDLMMQMQCNGNVIYWCN